MSGFVEKIKVDKKRCWSPLLSPLAVSLTTLTWWAITVSTAACWGGSVLTNRNKQSTLKAGQTEKAAVPQCLGNLGLSYIMWDFLHQQYWFILLFYIFHWRIRLNIKAFHLFI